MYAPNSCMDNSIEEIARITTQKIASSLSIIGSCHIITVLCLKVRGKRNSNGKILGIDPYNRIMAGFATFDIMYCFVYWFMGSWMTPEETGWWGALGNGMTCSMQGFFFSLWYGTAAYQMTSALQMMLLVTFSWTPNQFERRLERKLFLFIVLSTGAISIIPLLFGGYNPACGTCQVAPMPYWCGNWISGDGTTRCARGNATLANVYQYLLWAVASITTLFCSACMVTIYRTVCMQEQRMAKWKFSNSNFGRDGSNGKESNRIRSKIFFYASSFYICWITPLILWYTPHSIPSLHIVGDALFALMGFFNAVVFTTPKCVKYLEEHPGTNRLACFFFVILHTQIEFMMEFMCCKIVRTYATNSVGVDTEEDIDDYGIGLNSHVQRVSIVKVEALDAENAPQGVVSQGLERKEEDDEDIPSDESQSLWSKEMGWRFT